MREVEREKTEVTENDLMNEKSMRYFLTKKYIIEFVFLITIFSVIIICSWHEFIDKPTTGTLLGVVIGYFASDIRKIHT